jgi:hypothetical protein
VNTSILSSYAPPGVVVPVKLEAGYSDRQVSQARVEHFPQSRSIVISEVYMPRLGRWLPCTGGCEQMLSTAPGY